MRACLAYAYGENATQSQRKKERMTLSCTVSPLHKIEIPVGGTW